MTFPRPARSPLPRGGRRSRVCSTSRTTCGLSRRPAAHRRHRARRVQDLVRSRSRARDRSARRRASAARPPGPSAVDRPRRELDDYFAGHQNCLRPRARPRVRTGLPASGAGELASIRYGQTSTYGGLAERIGKPGAARAVGGALNRNPVPIVLPCHRDRRRRGRLVGYGGGLDRKRSLLALEGATL